MSERRGVIVEYGPDQVGYVADSESDVCIGFSLADLQVRQGEVPKFANGSRVIYRLNEAGQVAKISLDLANLALHGLKSA
jgi:hypothetical protein